MKEKKSEAFYFVSLGSLTSFISLCQRFNMCFHGAVWKYLFNT